MSSIKKLFEIPRPTVHLNGWRFWTPWAIGLIVNASLIFFHRPVTHWNLIPLGILIWLFSALFRRALFTVALSKLALLVTMASHVANLLLLSLLYVFIICPLGFFLRKNKKSPLQLRISREDDTYRIPSEKLDPQHFERPF